MKKIFYLLSLLLFLVYCSKSPITPENTDPDLDALGIVTDSLGNYIDSLGNVVIIDSLGNIIIVGPVVFGCTDALAFNFNSLASIDNDSCCYVAGCTDPTANNYDPDACFNDGSCCFVGGCMDITYLNYDPIACYDDGSCSNELLKIGDFFGGGVIFYLEDGGGIGGLICDILNYSAEWGCQSTPINGADGTAIGTGQENTIDILNQCSQFGIAAELCHNSTAQGYTDWFLPSKDELNEMRQNKAVINTAAISNGGVAFDGDNYWSSSQWNDPYGNDDERAWKQDFFRGDQEPNPKSEPAFVRAVRKF